MTDATDYFLANCKFAFKCTKTWESLEKTSEPGVRYCSDCQEEVFYCITKSEIVDALRDRKCISVVINDYSVESLLMGQIIER